MHGMISYPYAPLYCVRLWATINVALVTLLVHHQDGPLVDGIRCRGTHMRQWLACDRLPVLRDCRCGSKFTCLHGIADQ